MGACGRAVGTLSLLGRARGPERSSRVMPHDFYQETFGNGLTLLAERMPSVRSAAFALLVPAGAAYEPADRAGSAGMLAEWAMRGAGGLDSRALLSELDGLGISHAMGAQVAHASASGVAIGRNLIPALEIFADVVRRPRFDDREIEPIRALALQSLLSIEDDPGSKTIYELRRRHYPDPWGRPAPGTAEGLEATTAEDLRKLHRDTYRPNGAILAVAGAIDWEALRDAVDRLYGDWEPGPDSKLRIVPTGPRRDSIAKETQQTQIALAYPAPAVADPDYYRARAAVGILGGYSSARLFTEVREKRGLCYSVFASYDSVRDLSAVLCYAGTTPERAQETLDVTLGEVRRLAESGVEAEELDTMRAGLKSSLVMQQESSLGRAGALASDWYHLGRVRDPAEIAGALDALTPEDVSEYAARQRIDDLTILTLGPAPLELPATPR